MTFAGRTSSSFSSPTSDSPSLIASPRPAPPSPRTVPSLSKYHHPLSCGVVFEVYRIRDKTHAGTSHPRYMCAFVVACSHDYDMSSTCLFLRGGALMNVGANDRPNVLFEDFSFDTPRAPGSPRINLYLRDTSCHHNWMRPRFPKGDEVEETQVPENQVGRVEIVYGLLHVCLHLI